MNNIPKDDLTGNMVREFIREFEASLDPRLWAKLIQEEYEELEEALSFPDKRNILKEAQDLLYVQIGFNNVSVGAEQLGLFSEREHGELMNLLGKAGDLYTKAIEALGTVNLYEAFRRVHLSNMSKMGEDGLPLKDSNGKILKGPNYKEPDLDDLV